MADFFVLILPLYSLYDNKEEREREQQDIIQRMPVNDQIHITKRATFTVFIFFFCSQCLALNDFKMLSE